MDARDSTAVRKRGLQLVGVAFLLVVVALVLLGRCEPERGAYPVAVQPFVHSSWVAAMVALAVGLFRAVVGAPEVGPFRMVRTAVAVLIGIVAVPLAIVGAFVLHGAMTFEGDRTHDDGDDVDWDWD